MDMEIAVVDHGDARRDDAQADITVGSSLTAVNGNSSWLSPSGDFAFGFRSLSNGNNAKDERLFLLSIWYNKIPSKTVVWFANGDRPAPENSKLALTSNLGLVLTDPQGEELWKSESILGDASRAIFNDTGNFVILDSKLEKLWQSFKDPRNTSFVVVEMFWKVLLKKIRMMKRSSWTKMVKKSYCVCTSGKGQKWWNSNFEGKEETRRFRTLGKNELLASRRSEEIFSRGKFQLRMLNRGDLVLNTINLPSNRANEEYNITKTADDSNGSASSGKELVFSDSGSLFVLKENGEEVYLSRAKVPSASDFYLRVTLDFDGVLTQYVHPRNSNTDGNWSILWTRPNNICSAIVSRNGIGVCGYNSICTLGENNRPNCRCPDRYTLVDPSDEHGNCVPNFTLSSCLEDEDKRNHGSAEDIYAFVELKNTAFPPAGYEMLAPFSEDECRNSCLHDCMCAAAVYRDGVNCWKKRLPLSNGRVNPQFNGKAMIKVPKSDLPLPPTNDSKFPIPELKVKEKNPRTWILAGSLLLGTSVLVNILFIGASTLGFCVIYRKKPEKINLRENLVETNLQCFAYQELFKATDGFKEELGRGAFGIVYKGFIPSDVAVAVKKLTNVFQDKEKEFRTEVNVIGQTHHKNLVRLLGFCDEGQERLLVYEFLSNGTLWSLLFTGEFRPSWNQRCQIASAIARGLLYLHEECTMQIIHCDIKPRNILLDEYYNARISDFGLAKLLKMDQSYTLTNIRGTRGYVAPEWFRSLPITAKVDVYSYGVLLLEIICCRSCLGGEMGGERERELLTDWAYDCFVDGKLDALVEGDIEALSEREKLKNLAMVAFWCVQEDPSLRPTMKKVTQMLDGTVEVPVPPCPFAFSSCTTIIPK
ncbi:G-type lectin S-receptor-like serine/threonine-protein kinase LECRK1 [Eucalyptus grandis]|uniref:G-type lectin S-receptor-like serine/threonine-protein kinase LECRK1 n=1 Tax=Eucalyptus grandis TaxID=71139 RepID=UPI00192E903A|nr:G-type lectin S-receptor-like serine/threonine-protein kinase LECRK1 [Eucalyptus grandis]